MSACQQAKAKRRQMRNGYAHMSGSMRRPHVSGKSYVSVGASIARAHAAAAAEARRKVKKK
jgi:hypothetical protein